MLCVSALACFDVSLRYLRFAQIVLSAVAVWSPLGKELLTQFTVYGPRYEKTGLRGFLPGPTQTGLYSHRICLDA